MDVLSGYSYSLLFGSGEKYTPKYHNQPFLLPHFSPLQDELLCI